MFKFFTKRYWQLRKKRKQIIRAIETIRGHAFYVYPSGGCPYSCYLCKEDTYEISTAITKTSLTGEKFYFRSLPVAYLCTRCATVSAYSGGGGESDMLVWNWIENPIDLMRTKCLLPRIPHKAEQKSTEPVASENIDRQG